MSAPDPTPPPEHPTGTGQTLFGLPRRTLALGTALALAAALVAGIVMSIVVDADDGDPTGSLTLEPADDVVGTPAAISYETFDGETANTGSYVGRPLVLNFFAEWCAPCVAEMPDFETVHQEVGDEVAFLGLSTLESADSALALIETTGITYDVGRDAAGEAFAEAGGLQMPTTVFIDAAGTIVDVHTGALTAEALRGRIDSLLR